MAGLARFFPEASPVRMPVQLARIMQGSDPRVFISAKASSSNLAPRARFFSLAARRSSLAMIFV